ncbi:MAG: hypothetical protein AAGI11_02225 [Pseudomonadota bacterium]
MSEGEPEAGLRISSEHLENMLWAKSNPTYQLSTTLFEACSDVANMMSYLSRNSPFDDDDQATSGYREIFRMLDSRLANAMNNIAEAAEALKQ